MSANATHASSRAAAGSGGFAATGVSPAATKIRTTRTRSDMLVRGQRTEVRKESGRGCGWLLAGLWFLISDLRRSGLRPDRQADPLRLLHGGRVERRLAPR